MTNLQIIENKSLIKVYGENRISFLQGILTTDIKKFEKPSYSLMLNPTGRYLSDFFVTQHDDYILLEIPSDNKEQILKKLKMYKLRSEVEISDVSDEFFIIFSDEEIVGSIFYSYSDPRLSSFGIRSIIHKKDYDILSNSNSDYYNRMKYQYGILDGSDLIYEKSIPISYGMHKLNAIDFEKGCYVGQEVISRSYYTGVIRKGVYILFSDTDIRAQQNDEILINDRKVGKILSVWKNYALALINNPENGDYNNIFGMVAKTKVQFLLPKWS